MKIIKQWSVLDCRQTANHEEAQSYDLIVVADAAEKLSVVRLMPSVEAPVRVKDGLVSNATGTPLRCPLISAGGRAKLTNAEVLKFADDHVAYLEQNACLCVAVACVQNDHGTM